MGHLTLAGPSRPGQHRATLLALLAALLAFSVSLSIVGPALPALRAAYDLGPTTVGWMASGFLVASCIAPPLAGRLGDMFGKRRMMLASLLAGSVGCVVAALADSGAELIVGRILQGLVSGVLPLSFAIAAQEFPPEKVPRALGIMSAVVGVAGGLGFVLGGPIAEYGSLRWLFWLPLILAVAATVTTLLFVPESRPATRPRVDVLGAALLVLAIVPFLAALTQGPVRGWSSSSVLGLVVLSALASYTWFTVERRIHDPFVDVRMLGLRGVWTANLFTALSGFGVFTMFVLVPVFASAPSAAGYGFDASAVETSLLLSIGPVCMAPGAIVGARLLARHGPRLPLVLAGTLTAAGLTCFLLGHRHEAAIAAMMAIQGFGVGLGYAPLPIAVMRAVRPEQRGVATGVNSITRNIGSAIGAQASLAIVAGVGLVGGRPSLTGFLVAIAVAVGLALVSIAVATRVPVGARETHPNAVPIRPQASGDAAG